MYSALRIIENSGASSYWDIGATGGGSPDLNFYVNGGTTSKLTIDSSGNATFSGKVGIGGKAPTYGITLAQGTGVNNKIAWTDSTPDFAASIYANSSNDKLTFATKNASNAETTALEIDTSHNATFAGTVTAAAYVGIPAGMGELFGKSVYLTTSTVGFLIETNITNESDSHKEQQLESDLKIKDQFRNILLKVKL